MMSVINNASVRNGNADYWARLGAVMKENRELGVSNEIYADLVLPVCDGGYLRDLIEPKPRYFNLTEKEEEKANETR